jgi:hypothetical protein
MHDNSARRAPNPSASATASSASLTYEPFYGLREKPFSLSADPRFLFRSPTHAPAFDALLAGIRRREGLIVLTGEIGTGKTTLCRSVLEHLDRRTFAAFVPDPFVSREDLLKTLLVDFGVISIGDLASGRFNGASRSDLSYPLYEFLDSLVPLRRLRCSSSMRRRTCPSRSSRRSASSRSSNAARSFFRSSWSASPSCVRA